jgi:Cache domain
VLDTSGRVIATTDGSKLLGVDESQQDYFRGVVRSGQSYLSSAYSTSNNTSQLLANAIAPIPGATRATPVGYLTAAVPLDQLQALVMQFSQQSGLGVVVTDQKGVSVGSSLNQRLGKVDPANQSWLDSALRGNDGLVAVDSPNGRLVLSHQHLPGAWVIAVWLPESTVVTPLNKLRNSTLLLTAALAIAVTICGALLYRVNRARDRALQQLSDATERRRIAREMNDTIVQDLVAAEASYDLGETDHSRSLLRTASRHARHWVGHLLTEDGPVRPGVARLDGTDRLPPDDPLP